MTNGHRPARKLAFPEEHCRDSFPGTFPFLNRSIDETV